MIIHDIAVNVKIISLSFRRDNRLAELFFFFIPRYKRKYIDLTPHCCTRRCINRSDAID